MPKVEMKQSWTQADEVQLSSLNQLTQYSGPAIAQGVGADQRIGNVINASALHIKGVLYNNSASETYVRLVVVGYNTAIGSTVNISQNLFDGTSAGVTGGFTSVTGLNTMYMPINKHDYKVYRDQTFRLGGSQTGTAASNTRMFSTFIKLNRKKIMYEGNATGDFNQNWTYTVCWITADANDDTSTGTNVELSSLTRFYFKDA